MYYSWKYIEITTSSCNKSNKDCWGFISKLKFIFRFYIRIYCFRGKILFLPSIHVKTASSNFFGIGIFETLQISLTKTGFFLIIKVGYEQLWICFISWSWFVNLNIKHFAATILFYLVSSVANVTLLNILH